jgi:long-chain acyl-CoA synthetase
MATTLIRLFLDAVSRYDSPAQFMRKGPAGWESIPARRAREDVECLAMGLRALGIGPGDHVAILSENRYEWPIADLAVLALGAVTVPIYPTLTAEQCRYILDHSEARLAIVSTAAQLAKLESAAARQAHPPTRVAMDAIPAPAPDHLPLATLMDRGRALRAQEPRAFQDAVDRVRPDDVATVIYTSGTTGEPKGALLTHDNIAFDVEASLRVVELRPSDTCLSFLPLCHIFERMGGLYAMLARGVTIAYAQGVDTVPADVVEVRPTVITGVPRFYEKVHGRVLEKVARAPRLRRMIFEWAMRRLRARARAHFEGRQIHGITVRLADRLVGAEIRARMGGRVRVCISGGAPLSPQVMEFFFAIGIPILEGYGLTETSPVICLNLPGREHPGSVGPPIPGVEVRIGEEGEILTRGRHVMRGYYRNEEATREAIRDGWFHTGDIGRFDQAGRLVITDRIKDLIVTAGGKKVAPQPIEAHLKTSPYVAEAVLIGDRRPFVVCLIVPKLEALESEARTRGWSTGSRAELLRHPEVVALFGREIERLNEGLAQFEKIKKFALLDRELSQESGELTPTLKVKRRVIAERFEALIAGLYAARAEPAGVSPETARAS